MPRTRTGCLALLLASAAVAGCGGGGGGGGKPVTVKAGVPLAFTAKEYKFNPGKVTVDAGGKTVQLAIKLHNSGALGHDLVVEKGGQEVGGTSVITNDKDAGATVRLQPGSYTFVCTVGDHEQLGMKGELTVR
jgi:plastocyanin